MTVIHSPYFLPWSGYFSKLIYANKFVILDNVYYSKRHYIDRSRIISTDGNPIWLSLPTGQNFQIPINQISFKANSELIEKIRKTLYHSYCKAKFFDDNFDQVFSFIKGAFNHNDFLYLISIEIIDSLIDYLDIPKPEVILASSIPTRTEPTLRIMDILEATKSKAILVGDGRSKSKHDFVLVKENGYAVYIQDFYRYHPEYSQSRRRSRPFYPGLSILDAIFNIGPKETRDLLFSPMTKPVPF